MRQNSNELRPQKQRSFLGPEPVAVSTAEESLVAPPATTPDLGIAPNALLAQFQGADRLLLSEEAVHRTKNLAQLANAVVHLRLVEGRKLADAEQLAQAYAEAGNIQSGSNTAPCATLLRRIAGGLTALFQNGGRDVSLDVQTTEIALTHDRRRVMILIASELIINALRHAFPADRSGSIFVTLRADGGNALLAVEDDGVGYDGRTAGQGSRILDGLTAMLGGTLSRSASHRGGLGVYVRFNADQHE